MVNETMEFKIQQLSTVLEHEHKIRVVSLKEPITKSDYLITKLSFIISYSNLYYQTSSLSSQYFLTSTLVG